MATPGTAEIVEAEPSFPTSQPPTAPQHPKPPLLVMATPGTAEIVASFPTGQPPAPQHPEPLLVISDQATSILSFSTTQPEPEGDQQSWKVNPLVSPKTATSAAHKSSALYISTETSGILLYPKHSGPPDDEELDEVRLISAFNTALSRACKAGKALKLCTENRASQKGQNAGLEGDNCEEKSKDFGERYAELRKYEQHLKAAYEKECKQLKEQLKAMEGKQKETDRDHEIEVLTLVEKHCKETRELKDKIAYQADCLEFQRLHGKQEDVATLKKWKKAYEDGCKEVEDLCIKLAKKEKSLFSLRSQINDLETTLKKNLLCVSKEHVKQQLERCKQIEKMVQQLPKLSSSEMDHYVEGISAEVDKMKSSGRSRGRSISWKH